MLTFEDFNNIFSIQATVFTSGYSYTSNVILKYMLQNEMFDGEPTVMPLPDDAPPQIPRIIMQSKDESYKLEVSPSRVNLFVTKKDKDGEIDINSFFDLAIKTLVGFLEHTNAKCSRIAAVVKRYHIVDKPEVEISKHFCKKSILDGPINDPRAFEIHALKTYSFLGAFQVNSWVRVRSGNVGPIDGKEHPVVAVEQDINTLAELMETQAYASKDIELFYKGVPEEFDQIIKKYFPVSNDE